MTRLPETGFLRLSQIVGDRRADPPIPALIPISRSGWWAGIKQGRYPPPLKLSPRCTVWKVEDVRALIDRASAQPTPTLTEINLRGN